MLSIEDATTAALAAAQSPDPPLLPNPPDSGVTGSGAEPESAGAVDVLGDHVNSLPGVGGLSPSTRSDVTVQGERSLVFPTTGTRSRCFLSPVCRPSSQHVIIIIFLLCSTYFRRFHHKRSSFISYSSLMFAL